MFIAFLAATQLSQSFVVVHQPNAVVKRKTSLGFRPKSNSGDESKNVLKGASFGPDMLKQIDSFDPFGLQRRESQALPTIEEQQDEDQQIGVWAARGLLLFVAMLWGTNFASVKYLETLCFDPPCDHSASEAALVRFGVAALASMPLLIGKRLDVIMGGLECGLWITLGYVTQAAALQSIPSGKCAFICSLTVVVVPLIETFLGKPLKSMNLVSAVVALAGVGVLEGLIDAKSLLHIEPALAADAVDTVTTATTSSITTAAAAAPSLLGNMAQSLGVSQGDILALGQPIGFGCAFMRIEHYVEKFKDVKDRVMTITSAQCLAVGLCAALWVLNDFHGHIPDMTYMVSSLSVLLSLSLSLSLSLFVSNALHSAAGTPSTSRNRMDGNHDHVGGHLPGGRRPANSICNGSVHYVFE